MDKRDLDNHITGNYGENQIANDRQVGGNHYQETVSGENLQHWDIAWQLDFDQFQYCITKYVFRHKQKKGLEDLKKARHHLDKYIELLESGMELEDDDDVR